MQPLSEPGKGIVINDYYMPIKPQPTFAADSLMRLKYGDVVEVASIEKTRDAVWGRLKEPMEGYVEMQSYDSWTRRWRADVAKYSEDLYSKVLLQIERKKAEEEARRLAKRKRFEAENQEIEVLRALPDDERRARMARRFYHRLPDGPMTPEKLSRWSESQPKPPATSVAVHDRWKGTSYIRFSAEDTRVKHRHSGELNKKVCLFQGNIVHLDVDAITNAANDGLWAGGGICGAIHDQAGQMLSLDCEEMPEVSGGRFSVKCPTGDCRVTPGYRLFAKHVIHAVGPTDESPALLSSAYRSVLEAAKKGGMRTLALCCLSAGIFGYPLEKATTVALRTVREWLNVPENAAAIDLIVFTVFLDHEKAVYQTLLPAYFPLDASADESVPETAPAPSAAPTSPTRAGGYTGAAAAGDAPAAVAAAAPAAAAEPPASAPAADAPAAGA